MIIHPLKWFTRKPRPVSYMDRADVKAALAEQAKARAKHGQGASAVYDLTHDLPRREVGR